MSAPACARSDSPSHGPTPCCRGRGFRALDCRDYDACLRRAGRANWDGWTCTGCRAAQLAVASGATLLDITAAVDALVADRVDPRGADLVGACPRCRSDWELGPCPCHAQPHPTVATLDARAMETQAVGVAPQADAMARAARRQRRRDERAARRLEREARRSQGCAECGQDIYRSGRCRQHYRQALKRPEGPSASGAARSSQPCRGQGCPRLGQVRLGGHCNACADQARLARGGARCSQCDRPARARGLCSRHYSMARYAARREGR